MAQSVPELDLDPFSVEHLSDPYPMHEQMRSAGPVVKLTPYDLFATSRHAEVRAVLQNHEVFISSAGVGLANFNKEPPFRPKSLILEADPPAHGRARNVLARILSPRSVEQLRASFMAEAEQLIDRLVLARDIDGAKDLAEVYPLKVFPDAVGLDEVGRANLLIYGDMIFNSFGPSNELLQRAAANVKPVTSWIMEHCGRAALRPGGLGDLIYQAADAGEITQEEAPLLVRSFLSAGVDTTVNGLGNALYCLAQHPDQYAKLHADPSRARLAFEEVLRFESPVQTFFRTAARDTELAGIAIPANSKIVTFLGGANRDPLQWPNADRFDIERRTVGHVAFGTGIHACVGQVVARMEGEFILSALARKVKHIEIVGAPVRRLNNTLRALASLPLRLTSV
jgi:4-methoxybenzoate monooxygenase (O-demethylating)